MFSVQRKIFYLHRAAWSLMFNLLRMRTWSGLRRTSPHLWQMCKSSRALISVNLLIIVNQKPDTERVFPSSQRPAAPAGLWRGKLSLHWKNFTSLQMWNETLSVTVENLEQKGTNGTQSRLTGIWPVDGLDFFFKLPKLLKFKLYHSLKIVFEASNR